MKAELVGYTKPNRGQTQRRVNLDSPERATVTVLFLNEGGYTQTLIDVPRCYEYAPYELNDLIAKINMMLEESRENGRTEIRNAMRNALGLEIK